MKRLTTVTLCTLAAFGSGTFTAAPAGALISGVGFTMTATDAAASPLAGASFEVKECTRTPPGTTSEPWDCLTSTGVSGADGLVPNSNGKADGWNLVDWGPDDQLLSFVSIKETGVPSGYRLDASPRMFVVDSHPDAPSAVEEVTYQPVVDEIDSGSTTTLSRADFTSHGDLSFDDGAYEFIAQWANAAAPVTEPSPSESASSPAPTDSPSSSVTEPSASSPSASELPTASSSPTSTNTSAPEPTSPATSTSVSTGSDPTAGNSDTSGASETTPTEPASSSASSVLPTSDASSASASASSSESGHQAAGRPTRTSNSGAPAGVGGDSANGGDGGETSLDGGTGVTISGLPAYGSSTTIDGSGVTSEHQGLINTGRPGSAPDSHGTIMLGGALATTGLALIAVTTWRRRRTS